MKMLHGLSLNRRRAGGGVLTAPTAGNGIPDQQLVVGEALPEAINVTEAFNGIVDSYSLDPTSDALPAGLSLSGSFIDGTPSAAAGPLSIVIRATNAAGHVTTTFTLTTFAVPTVTGSIANVDRNHDGSTPFTVATAAEFTGTVTGYSISAPSGITINSSTGVVSIGAFDYTAASVQVFALNGPAISAALSFTVTQSEIPAANDIEALTTGSGTSATTPAGTAGDMLVILAAYNSTTSPVTVTASGGETVVTDTATMQHGADSHCWQAYYIKLAAATTGLTLTLATSASTVQMFNIGPHDFHSAAKNTEGSGSTPTAMPTLADVPINSKVFYFTSRRTGSASDPANQITGTGSLVTDPALPAASGEYFLRNTLTLIDIITQSATGNTPTVQHEVAGTVAVRGGFTIAFNPVSSGGGGALPGQYIADDNGVGFARSSDVSSFDIETQTFTMSETVQVGHYNDASGNIGLGTIWVKPISPSTTVTVDSYTPAYGVLANGNTGHGAMLNVVPITGGAPLSAGRQGFNTGIGNNPVFDATAVDEVPITMSPDDVLLVAESVTTTQTENELIANFAIIHCVNHVPADDEFAPPMIWHPSLGARPRYAYSDVDETGWPALSTASAGTVPAFADLKARFPRRVPDFVSTQGRYGMRSFRSGNFGKVYGKNIMDNLDDCFAYIVSDQPIEQRRQIAKFLIQRGIDDYGSMRARFASGADNWLGPDGGHQAGRMTTVIVAGHLLGDTTMRDWIKNNTSPTASTARPELGMRAYLTADAIAATLLPGWDGSGGGANEPYQTAMGDAPAVPEWMGNIAPSGVIDPGRINNIWSTSNYYRTTGATENAGGHTLALLAYGLRTAVNHDAFFDYHARWHAMAFYRDDPWRYVDGVGTPRYDYMSGAPTGSPITPTSFAHRMYDIHAFQSPTYYEFPAGVNDFNGAT